MEVINILDEESREGLRKKVLKVYTRQRNVPQYPSSDPKLPQQGLPPPPTIKLLPTPTLPKTSDIDLNIDIDSVLEKTNVPVPMKEIISIPSMKNKIKKFFKV